MTDKVVRDEILRSHRYVSLSSDTAKLLFLHLFLSSDSLSNAEATTTALSIIMGRAVTEQAAASLLTEMADRDLIRIYEAEGKRYVHIPRSRQRLRYLRGKHPRPPPNVEDKEITELIAQVGLKTDPGQTQDGPEPREAKRSIAKRSDAKNDLTAGSGETWAQHWLARGNALGIQPKINESERNYCSRVQEFEKQR